MVEYHKKLLNMNIYTFLLSLFFILTIFYTEKTSLINEFVSLNEYIQVIKEDLWTYDSLSLHEYTELTIEFNHYDSVTIYSKPDNKLFIQITSPPLGTIESFLTRIGAISRKRIGKDIYKDGFHIGHVEVILRHRTVYKYVYVFLLLSFIWMILYFFIYNAKMRHSLEVRVEERSRTIQKKEEQYRTLVASIPGVTFISRYEDKFPINFISKEIVRLTGYHYGEFTANDTLYYDSVVHPDDKTSFNDHIKASIDRGSHFLFEYRIIHKDGSIRWVLEKGHLQKIQSEAESFLLGVIIDITEKKEIENKVYNLKSLLSNILDSMPFVLICVNSQEMVTQWNKRAEEVTNIKSSQALNRPLLEVYPLLEEVSEEMRKSVSLGIKLKIPRRERLGDKGQLVEDITIYPITLEGEKSTVLLIDDITEYVLLEDQLRHGQKMDALGQLAGGVAHDFNNMLGAIIGASQLLLKPIMGLNEEATSYVNMIEEASLHAADLTKRLLVFGHKAKLKKDVVDVNKVIGDTISIIDKTIDKKIVLETQLESQNSHILGDESLLQNVILNLSINSSHAMLSGGRLTLTTKDILLDSPVTFMNQMEIEPGMFVVISVSDTGSGISEENLSRIFEPFFTTKEDGKGTGLGLAAVYGTVKEHGGGIEVLSEINRGTEFKIYLPTVDQDLSRILLKKEMLKGHGKVLLVDDEKSIRIIGEKILQSLGFDVFVAKNGLEAVEIYEGYGHEIDLVITDMMMPKMDGKETFYKLREINPHCKVIISSGYSKEESLLECKENGLSGTISKPYTIYELSQIIRSVLLTDPPEE